VNTTFKVSVSREDGRGNHVVVDDDVLDLFGEITRVTDAGHAAVSSGGEPKFVEVGVYTSFLVVLGDDVGSWGEGSLDIGFDGETSLDSVLCEDASGEHDIGVGRVSARSDGGDDEVTLLKDVVLALIGEGGRLFGLSLFKAEALETDGSGEAFVEILLHVDKVNAIVGSLGTGKGSLDLAEVELHDITGVGGVGLFAIVLDEEILFAEVLLNELNVTRITTGQTKVLHGAFVDWEVSHCRAVLGSHVSDGSSVGEGKCFNTRSEELDELTDNSTLSEHLNTGEDEISSSGTLGQLIAEVEANNLG